MASEYTIGLKIQVDTKTGQVKLAKLGKEGERAFEKISNAAQRLKERLLPLSSLAAKVGAVFAAWKLAEVAKSAVQVGASFEQMMLTVKGVMRASESEFKLLTQVAREMGEKTEWSATQAAEALKYLGMAGFSATQAAKALPSVLDLATASGIDLARAADIASNAMTAMGLKVEDLSRVNDVLVGTITRTNTNMEMLADSFKYAAPVAHAYGYSIEKLSALIGVLGNAGIQGSMAGTQLAQAFQRVSKVWEKLGRKGYGGDLVEALEAIKKAGWSTQQVMDVFGQEAGRAALALLDNIDAVKKLDRELHKTQGEAKRLADMIRSALGNQFKALASVIESYAISAFKIYKDDARNALQAVTEYLRKHKKAFLGDLQSIYEGTKKVASSLSGVAGAVKTIGKAALWVYDKLGLTPEEAVGGLIGALLFGRYGAKAAAIGAGLGILSHWASTLGKAIKLAFAGELSWIDIVWSNTKELDEKIRQWEAKQREPLHKSIYVDWTVDPRKINRKHLLKQGLLTYRDIDEAQRIQEEIVKRINKATENIKKAKTAQLTQERYVSKEVLDIEKKLKNRIKQLSLGEYEYKVYLLDQEYQKRKEQILKAYKGTKEATEKLKTLDKWYALEKKKLLEEHTEKTKRATIEQIQAYKSMYETLREWGYSDYTIQAQLIEAQKEKFIQATKNKVLAEKWASAELQKAWEEDRLRFGGFADGIIVAYERMKRSATSFAKMAYDSFYGFVNNARRTFSDLFYDTFTGKLKSLKDYWESFWHSMLRIFSDKLAEMVVNWMLGIKRMQEGISGGSGLVRAIAGVTGTSVTTLSAIKAAGGGSGVGVGGLGVAGGLLGKIFTAPSMLEANWVFRALSKIPGVQVIRMPEGAVLAVNGVPLAKILSSAGWASLGYGILGKLVGLPSGTIPAITSTAGAIGGGLAGASLIGGSLGGPVGAGIGALLGGALGGLFGGKHHPGKYGWQWRWPGIRITPTGEVEVGKFETWRIWKAGEKVKQNLHNWFSEAVSNLMQNTGEQIEKVLQSLPEYRRREVIDKISPIIAKINREFSEVTYITQLEALRQQAPAVQNYIYTTFLPRLKQASAELMAVLEQAIRTATATVRRHTGIAGGIRGAGVSGGGEVSDLTLKLRKVSQDYAKDVLKAYTETLAKAEDVVRIYIGRTKFGQPVYWTGQWKQFTQARFRQMKEQYGLRDIPSDIINKMWDLRKKALYQQYMQLSKMQQGGTVKGPSSGYHFEAIFHGTEHIVPESQMKGVKEELKEIRNLIWMLVNTTGEQHKYNKRTYQVLQKWDVTGLPAGAGG